MAEEDEAIDADVDVGDTLKTLLEATRSQATVNAALVTQLMNINTTQGPPLHPETVEWEGPYLIRT